MRPPKGMNQLINGLRYSVDTATELASNAYWDGHNFERGGTNTYLYRTNKGRYFRVYLTQWQGDSARIEPLNEQEAYDLYEGLKIHSVEVEEAFPSITVEDA